MTIGIDGSRAFLKERTGTENYTFQLLKALAKIDRRNNYLIYLRPGSNIMDRWPNNFHFSILNYQFFWTQAGLAQQTFKEKLDILFIPAHTLPIIRKPKLKTIVTVHDLGSEYLPQLHQLKQRLYLSFIQKIQLKGASHLIAVSKATKKDLINRIGINEKKITVIYEGYDREKFKINQTINKYNLRYHNYFLFVGTIQPRKNLERLIEAFDLSHLSHLSQLVIVGKKGWMADDIYNLPEKLGLKNRVKFLDYIPDKNLPALYRGAIALTFPSLFEGFGLPILEAQACGCPVITSSISSMPEVAGNAAILVDPYNKDEIAHAIIRIKDKSEREKLIKNGLENVKRFSWEKCAKETLKVIENYK